MASAHRIHMRPRTYFALVAAFLIIATSSCPAPAKASGAFLPSDISGLKVWLDASQPNSFYTDTGKTTLATTTDNSVSVWADHSGNGNDAVTLSGTFGDTPPAFTANTGNAYPGVDFTEHTIYDPSQAKLIWESVYLSLGNPTDLNFGSTGSTTIFTVYKGTNGSNWQCLLSKNSSIGVIREAWCVTSDQTQVADQSGIYTLKTGSPNSNNVYMYSYDPDSTFPLGSGTKGIQGTSLNGGFINRKAGAAPFDISDPWLIGGEVNNYLHTDDTLQAVLIYNRVLTDSEIAQVDSYLGTQFGVTVASVPAENTGAQVVYQGDSITNGYEASSVTKSYPWQIFSQEASGAQYRYYNLGTSGYTMSWVDGQASLVDSLYTPYYATSILPLLIGTNDLSGGTDSTADSTYASLKSYLQARQTTGYKTISMTMLPSAWTTDSVRQYYNSLIRNNYTQFSDALVDLGSDPTIGLAGENTAPYFYSDGVHPVDAGYTVIANDVKTAIDALLDPLTSVSSVATTTAATTATVTWTSNAPSSSIVDFGLSSAYGSSTPEINNASTTRATSHSVTVHGLPSCTQFHFRVQSNRLDATNDLVYLKNNTATSMDGTFFTGGCAGNAAIASSTASNITIAAGGSLKFGTTTISVPVSFTTASSSAYFQAKELNASSFFASAGTPSGQTKAGNYVVNLKALTSATTTLSSFVHPISVTLSYASADVSGLDTSTLKIYRYDAPTWTALTNCSVDTSAKTVTCDTSNFSDFALFGTPPATVSSSSSSGGSILWVPSPTPPPGGFTATASPSAVAGEQTLHFNFGSDVIKIVISDNTAFNPSTSLDATSTLEWPDSKTGTLFVKFCNTYARCSNPLSVSTPTSHSTVEATSTATSSESPFTYARDLTVRDTGADVTALQQFLLTSGYAIPAGATGYFGVETRAALAAYQKAHDINPSAGYFGPLTRASIAGSSQLTISATQAATTSVAYNFTRNLSLHDRVADVESLQKYLNAHDFTVATSGPGSAGNETEYFGVKTYEALARYQKSVGLPATGFFGAMTRATI